MEVASLGRRGHARRRRRGLGEALAHRIDRLAERHERRLRGRMAEALERAVDDLDRPLSRRTAAVPTDRRAVAESAPLLLQVAVRLRDPGPLPDEALRLARSLTGDGAGPLYAATPHRSDHPPAALRRFARAILAACEERDGARAREPGGVVEI